MSSNTGKRLAKNTVFMYGRMILLMALSLYTSRIVLQQLGVEDYGIYNVVGSVVAMLSSLRTIFASSTQRFLNFEMGQGNQNKLKLVFNTSILVNGLVAVVFVIAAEAIGYWFMNYQINVAPDRLFAAKVVLQFSIVTSVITLMTTPLDALIISHERMDFYAYLSIFEAILKLANVFALTYIGSDKLITYGVLHFVISCIVWFIDYIYCHRKFLECRIKIMFDKGYFVKMTKFAGWNFLGNTAYTLTQNGLNMVLNVFGGAIVNAARGIAYQVTGSLNQFLVNINIVVTPYTIKCWAAGEKDQAYKMFYMSSKILFCVQLCLVVPLTFLTEEILQLWLGQVPEYSVAFIQLVLLNTLIRSTHAPLDTLFKANGRLKEYQIAESVILSLPLLASYLLLKCGAPFFLVFVSIILFEVINYILIVLICKKVVGLPLMDYMKNVVLHCGVCTIVSYCILTLLYFSIWSPTVAISATVITLLICFAYMFFVGFSNDERASLLGIFKRRE